MYAKINTESCPKKEKKFSPVVQSSEWRHPCFHVSVSVATDVVVLMNAVLEILVKFGIVLSDSKSLLS